MEPKHQGSSQGEDPKQISIQVTQVASNAVSTGMSIGATAVISQLPQVKPVAANAHPPMSTPVLPLTPSVANPPLAYSPRSSFYQDPTPTTHTTRVYIYPEELFYSTTTNEIDKSLPKMQLLAFIHTYRPYFVVSETSEAERAKKKFLEMYDYDLDFDTVVLKDLIEEGRRGENIKIVLSDELISRQKATLRAEIVSSGYCIIFASLFTDNECFVGVDYSKTETGQGTATLPSKIKYCHLTNRVKVGLFIENSYLSAANICCLLEDTKEVQYIPLSFWDVPNIHFDFMLHRAVHMKAKCILNNDAKAKKALDNYLKYEEKNKKTVFLDKFDSAKIALYRSEFIEELIIQSEKFSETYNQDLFEVPRTRGGDYLDILINPNKSDPTLSKIASNIPYPLLAKTDIACGSQFTHEFILIKEAPQNWPELKATISEFFKGQPFIVQQFIANSKNIVLTAVILFDNFSYRIHEGLLSSQPLEKTSGTVLGMQHEKLMNLCPEPLGKYIDSIALFQREIAKRLRLNLIELDYLIDTERGKILPIDLNEMPKLELVPQIESIFRENLVSKPGEQVKADFSGEISMLKDKKTSINLIPAG